MPPRAIGVDFGGIWTGLAAAELGRATPLRVVRSGGGGAAGAAAFARELLDEAAARGAGGVVVGIPLRPGQRLTDPTRDNWHVRARRAAAGSSEQRQAGGRPGGWRF